ncbi:MAG TPA: GNAT family N-acetyltransferase [Nitrososphaeraceae archaeon]
MASTNFPKLFGVLVNLREVSINDAQHITNLMNYNISKYLYDVPNPYSVEDALNFIKSAHSDFNSLRALHFAIEYKEDKSELSNNPLLVGAISLKNIDLVNKKANLGYWIGEQYWGRGIATECVGLIIDYAFSDELELEEVSAYVFPENKASIRVLEKNEMKKKGEVNEYYTMSGRYRNSLKYTRVRESDKGRKKEDRSKR